MQRGARECTTTHFIFFFLFLSHSQTHGHLERARKAASAPRSLRRARPGEESRRRSQHALELVVPHGGARVGRSRTAVRRDYTKARPVQLSVQVRLVPRHRPERAKVCARQSAGEVRARALDRIQGSRRQRRGQGRKRGRRGWRKHDKARRGRRRRWMRRDLFFVAKSRPPATARRLARRCRTVHRWKHGSWLCLTGLRVGAAIRTRDPRAARHRFAGASNRGARRQQRGRRHRHRRHEVGRGQGPHQCGRR